MVERTVGWWGRGGQVHGRGPGPWPRTMPGGCTPLPRRLRSSCSRTLITSAFEHVAFGERGGGGGRGGTARPTYSAEVVVRLSNVRCAVHTTTAPPQAPCSPRGLVAVLAVPTERPDVTSSCTTLLGMRPSTTVVEVAPPAFSVSGAMECGSGMTWARGGARRGHRQGTIGERTWSLLTGPRLGDPAAPFLRPFLGPPRRAAHAQASRVPWRAGLGAMQKPLPPAMPMLVQKPSPCRP